VAAFLFTGTQGARADGEDPRTTDRKGAPQTYGGSNTTNRVELREKAAKNGTLRVLVTLNLAYSPEAALDANAIKGQRSAITAATQKLLGNLSGLKYTLNATYYAFPLVGLTVDSAGLEKLFTLPEVAQVAESTLKHPDLAQSTVIIGAVAAQGQGYNGTGYAVAILDTGFQTNHPFLAGRTVAEACFSRTVAADNATTLCPNGQSTSGSTPGQSGTGAAANCSATLDGCEHGTHVAGITLGKNYSGGPGYNGVAPGANLIAIQVFSKITSTSACSPSPSPCLSAYDEDIIAALQYVQGLSGSFNISSINMSLGDGVNNATPCDTSPYFTVVGSLRTANIATAIAAGNEGYTAGLSGPACVSNSISVGSTTKADAISSFSNRANYMSLWAPGSSITSSVPTSTYANLSGTSMATPHVAGAWAIMRQKFPSESVTQILTRLQNKGIAISGSPSATAKRIQIDGALDLATATATNTPLPPTASSTPPAAAYMVQDGSFEVAGYATTYWAQTSTNFGTPLCTEADCGGVGTHTGTYWAWFGGTSSAETASLQQVKKIAPGPKALTFWLWWSSSVSSPPDPNAYFRVRMDGNIIFSLTPATAAAYNAGYTYVSVDISSYADDGTHTLRFEGGNAASTAATNIHLDDINLIGIAGGATNTPTRTSTPTATVNATATRTNTPTATATASNTPVPPRPDTIGVYNGGVFYLRNTNTTGVADITAFFGGDVSDLPVVGDWNGDGVDTIGVYRNSTGFFFLSDSNTSPAVNYSPLFGNPGDTPFAGKWTADMTHDGIGVYRNSNGILYQRKALTGGFDDFFAVYGNPGDKGFAGDWDANGFDSVGIYRSSNQTWFLSNNSTPSGITFSDISFVLDIASALPVVGDWDGDGDSTPGWLTSGGVFTLHPNNSIVGPDNVFAFGPANSKPVAGKWVAGSRPGGPTIFNPNAPGGYSNADGGSGD
jgi:subtilisin family serine protease